MNDSERCAQAKNIIQKWIDKQGHERCWYYPEMFEELAVLFEVKATKHPNLPPRKEFEEGCRRYQVEEYSKKKQ